MAPPNSSSFFGQRGLAGVRVGDDRESAAAGNRLLDGFGHFAGIPFVAPASRAECDQDEAAFRSIFLFVA
jgi:hypothetical protein